MPFDHNDHYQPLLLRHLPRTARTALDVGCGTGGFARRLAGLGLEVDAVDPSAETIAAARAASARVGSVWRPDCRQADVTRTELSPGRYDYISCLASLHHMPFETVSALRDALAPGGVLVVLGCYPERSRTDWAWSLAAVPANAAARLAVTVRERASGRPRTHLRAPVQPPQLTYDETRREAARLLPGSTVRRLLFWRYLLTYRRPAT
ncbi:class I SAM-dependent methyltransferase [Saccharothrix sp. ST-888]|uniref:class I SAM-dependent methyltransferase n=1 Tax=Saccharothrix sp. ST-888 TaxID=1427391 RepID=UPI0005EC93BA|nr:class I SAM-dependent methyltransferase [Saccharothrix sp. ST-888]KJK58623.1 methyltransferase [Saccharothrix sp. ST-888]